MKYFIVTMQSNTLFTCFIDELQIVLALKDVSWSLMDILAFAKSKKVIQNDIMSIKVMFIVNMSFEINLDDM